MIKQTAKKRNFSDSLPHHGIDMSKLIVSVSFTPTIYLQMIKADIMNKLYGMMDISIMINTLNDTVEIFDNCDKAAATLQKHSSSVIYNL